MVAALARISRDWWDSWGIDDRAAVEYRYQSNALIDLFRSICVLGKWP